ncbi:hypothetical protein [Tautonia plasticadhaerens]|uniref:Uncharacterized protein n=1 Tax=Tautonia plasticadhaerens TaxID=2527974 RepID=A0A518H846_9BACT|nr:hypothetical protein [Tautonia plasticadhaerens]QDV37032.1 hypothetical protein ElP_49650 [Tautonia plasticadhaerens]
MTHEEFFDRISGILGPIGCRPDDGEDYRDPPLEVIRYDLRPVRLHWFPVLGHALSVVAFVRQPADLSSSSSDLRRLLDRIGRAVHGRYPPWPKGGPGLVIGLTSVVISPEPIGPADEESLASAIPRERRSRIIPLALIRVNLGQEAMAIAPAPDLKDLFPEPFAIADEMSQSLGRFVPPLELG